MVWLSLLGLGASAAAFGLGRNRNNGMGRSVQNGLRNNRFNNFQQAVSIPGKNVFAEFAEEMVPNQSPGQDRQNQN
ncbi:hypothetical protein ACFOU2_21585 [Bacillus songklensis]|uniref:Uncharacterized protein n=2 Tax=Bacillus songklensis TaxID=1069116 RepID=A0ABV8B6J1_9BACI